MPNDILYKGYFILYKGCGRIGIKQVLKAKKKRFEQHDSSGSDEDDEEVKIIPQPKISKSIAKMQDMERKHKELEEQFETMKRGKN